jgi:hypothetical protein
VTFCPSDKLLCKILCCDFLSCDFLSYMFCQNAKFKLWLFVLWLFARDFLSVTFCPVTFCPTFQTNIHGIPTNSNNVSLLLFLTVRAKQVEPTDALCVVTRQYPWIMLYQLVHVARIKHEREQYRLGFQSISRSPMSDSPLKDLWE